MEAIPASRRNWMSDLAPANPLRNTTFVMRPSDIPRAELPMYPRARICLCLSDCSVPNTVFLVPEVCSDGEGGLFQASSRGIWGLPGPGEVLGRKCLQKERLLLEKAKSCGRGSDLEKRVEADRNYCSLFTSGARFARVRRCCLRGL